MYLSSRRISLLGGIVLGGAMSVFPSQQASAQFNPALGSQMLLAQADVPEVDTPEVDTPEVEVPEAEAPEVEAPEAEAPEAEAPEAEAPEAEAQQVPTIVGLAASSDAFETLVQALQTAELVDTLSGPGPFTVFAPTDDAFAQLPDGVVEALLQPENRDLLTDILTYHVVDGEVPSTAVTSGPVPTLSEDELTAEVGEVITIDGATVLQPDAQASNGIIHVIDAVLVPQSALPGVQALLEETEAAAPAPSPEPAPAPASEPESEPEPAPEARSSRPEASATQPVRGLW